MISVIVKTAAVVTAISYSIYTALVSFIVGRTGNA